MTDNREQPENKKIERLYVTEEMASDANMDQEIRNGLIRDTGKTEEQIRNQTNQSGLSREVKEKMYANIVQDLKEKGLWEEEKEETATEKEEIGEEKEDAVSRLSPSDREALEVGRKILAQPKTSWRKKLAKGVAGAAVVMIGVFVVGMSSEANRLRILSVWNSMVGEELRINMDNGADRNQDGLAEQEAYDTIKSKCGIESVKFMYKPQELVYSNYTIHQNGGVYIFYKYLDSVVTVYMYKQSTESSRSQLFDGEIIDTVKLSIDDLKVNIKEVKNLDGKNAFVAGFSRNNVYYALWGQMQYEEFKKIVSGIYFK